MAEIHVLNVGQGDCIIFRSGSGHITAFDICGGNIPQDEDRTSLILSEKTAVRGNYRMCKHPTNPIRFLIDEMGVSSVFRFILSHPEMDHMDGFNNLFNSIKVLNFWDSGVRREKPDFSEGPYKEEDWDRYVLIRDEKESGVTIVTPRAGSEGQYWNKDDKGGGGDYITVCSPDKNLIDAANNSEESRSLNEASYVIYYRSEGGRILLTGDAHDKTWDYVLEHYESKLKNCEFMVAPHHGRDSNRSWEFLDKINPKFSVLGCASSEHLAYNAWNSRGLEKITQNQAGNIAIYPRSKALDIYVENIKFASDFGGDSLKKDKYGNFFLKTIAKEID